MATVLSRRSSWRNSSDNLEEPKDASRICQELLEERSGHGEENSHIAGLGLIGASGSGHQAGSSWRLRFLQSQ